MMGYRISFGKELCSRKNKKTVTFQKYPFYETPINASEEIGNQFCFGCHESQLLDPKSDLWPSTEESATKKLHAILNPLHRDRPKPDADK